uniref:PIN domain-containing protein n=1 Tax=Halomonas sp. TaxID=1486246 RepID=UPI00345B3E3D
MCDADPVDLKDPETGKMVERASARANALVEMIDQRNGVVIIPAPVLAEYLIGISQDAYQAQLDLMNSFSCIEISPFDDMSAIECALLVDEQEHKVLDPNATKAKLRFDRQILAIALANGADELWTHDKGLFFKAKASGVTTKSLAKIAPLPDQKSLDLPPDED